MMLPIRDEAVITNSKTDSSTNLWFYLSVEFLVGAVISGILSFLDFIKAYLPKPPKDLTGNVVLVAGASSRLGESLVEEFAESGCSVICVDNDLRSVEEITDRLRSRYCRVKEIGPGHRKRETQNAGAIIMAYQCDLLDRDAIRRLAKKVEDEVGGLDVLVTCVGLPNEDIFDTASKTLMSYYWTVLAFLPSILQRDKAHVVGITPVTSSEDTYLASRVAIASLMESLGQELSNRNNRLTFLALSPTTDSSRRNEQQLAMEVVRAIKRNQSSIYFGWGSEMLYRISCAMYNGITMVTQWFHT